MKELQVLVAEQKIPNKIYVIRGEKVMLDQDLSGIYAVETKRLKRQVKRNADRFPKDFMFTLNNSHRSKHKNYKKCIFLDRFFLHPMTLLTNRLYFAKVAL